MAIAARTFRPHLPSHPLYAPPPAHIEHVNQLPDRIRVATDCSGLDAPIQALRALGVRHRHVFSSDIDKSARAFLELNGDAETMFGDISTRDVAYAAEADLYVAGFPCQSFSKMNSRHSESDPRKYLWRHCVAYIKAKRPMAFVLENVRNLLTAYGGQVWTEISAALDGLEGYNWAHKILDAKEHGCPQSRSRLFIVGTRSDQSLFKTVFPEPIKLTKRCVDVLNHEDDVGACLGQADTPAFVHRFLASWNFPPGASGIIEVNSASMGTRPYKMSALSASTVEEMQKKALACVRTDAAPCLVAHNPGHYSVDLKRLLNVNEMLRLQGFDPRHVRCDGITPGQMQKLVGNSMCVDVLKRLFVCMLAIDADSASPPPPPPSPTSSFDVEMGEQGAEQESCRRLEVGGLGHALPLPPPLPLRLPLRPSQGDDGCGSV